MSEKASASTMAGAFLRSLSLWLLSKIEASKGSFQKKTLHLQSQKVV